MATQDSKNFLRYFVILMILSRLSFADNTISGTINNGVLYQGVTYNTTDPRQIDKLLRELNKISAFKKYFSKILSSQELMQKDLSIVKEILEQSGGDYRKLKEELERRNKEKELLVKELENQKRQNTDEEQEKLLGEAEKVLENNELDKFQSILTALKKKRKEQIRKEEQNLAMAYYLSSKGYMLNNEYNKAIAELLEAIKLTPNNTAYYNKLGLIYYLQGSFGKALEYYDKALKINLNMLEENRLVSAVSYMNIGSVYHLMGILDKASESYLEALKIILNSYQENNLDMLIVHISAGFQYQTDSKFYESIVAYEKALRLHTLSKGSDLYIHEAFGIYVIGMHRYSSGMIDKARLMLEEAYSILQTTADEKHLKLKVERVLELVKSTKKRAGEGSNIMSKF